MGRIKQGLIKVYQSESYPVKLFFTMHVFEFRRGYRCRQTRFLELLDDIPSSRFL